MYLATHMTESELEARKTGGCKAKYVSTYWGTGEPLPGKVTRLYVVVGSELRGYFEVHGQQDDTLMMWSESWTSTGPLEAREFKGYLQINSLSDLLVEKKPRKVREKKVAEVTSEQEIELSEVEREELIPTSAIDESLEPSAEETEYRAIGDR